MRTARIKIAAEEGAAVYHCMSRTVNGERVIDDAGQGNPAPAALAHGRILAPIAGWGGLNSLRGLRKNPFG